MRRLFAIFFLLGALVLPAAALAMHKGPDDGSLVVQNAHGTIVLQVRGGVIGRFESGRIVVDDPNPDDAFGPVFFGCERPQDLSETRTACKDTNVRFRVLGGTFRVKIVGSGITLSAVGVGSVTMTGAGSLDDGQYAFDDDPLAPLPEVTTRFVLGTPASVGRAT